AHYSLGVITWAKFYPALTEACSKLGMKPEDPGPLPDPAIRQDLMNRYGSMIEAGLIHLERALQLDPKYDDSMAYLNLLIRERADLRDTAGEYKRDIQVADDWVKKALETKKANVRLK